MNNLKEFFSALGIEPSPQRTRFIWSNIPITSEPTPGAEGMEEIAELNVQYPQMEDDSIVVQLEPLALRLAFMSSKLGEETGLWELKLEAENLDEGKIDPFKEDLLFFANVVSVLGYKVALPGEDPEDEGEA